MSNMPCRIQNLIAWIKVWYLVIVFSLGTLAVIFLRYIKYIDNQTGTFLVLALTLIALSIYAKDTHIIALVNQKSASPTISYNIISGKNYHINQLNVDPLNKRLLREMRVIIKNDSRFSTDVFLDLNLKVNGKLIDQGWDDYCGRKPWKMLPFFTLNGHFNLEDRLRESNIDIEELEKSHNQRLTMEIKIWNIGLFGDIIEYPIRKWRFDFSSNAWWNEDFGYYA